jgi:hypothetical protein
MGAKIRYYGNWYWVFGIGYWDAGCKLAAFLSYLSDSHAYPRLFVILQYPASFEVDNT